LRGPDHMAKRRRVDRSMDGEGKDASDWDDYEFCGGGRQIGEQRIAPWYIYVLWPAATTLDKRPIV
jgi:hypothetical protein